MENYFIKIYFNIERPKETKEYLTNIGIVKFDLTTNSFYSLNNNSINSLVEYWFREIKTFEESVEPAIKYLLKQHHPHTNIIISYNNAELLEGIKSHNVKVPD